MSKLYATIESDRGGRIAGKGGEEYLDIDIRVGNETLARLTVRRTDDTMPDGSAGGAWALHDEDDNAIRWLSDHCNKRHTPDGECY